MLTKNDLSSGTRCSALRGNAAGALCELSGMWYAKGGTKAVPFDISLRTLGLHCDAWQCSWGFLRVAH